MSFYDFIYGALKGPVKLIFGVSVEGKENLPEKGGYLVCANHASVIDVFVLVCATGKQIKFMAKKEICATPVIGPLIKALGAYPVNRGTADTIALKKTASLLEEGEFVGMFPQGTRHPGENPRQTEVKHGVGLVMFRSKCGAIPIYIKTEGYKPKFFKKTKVIIGKPMEYDEFSFTEGGKKEFVRASEELFDRICQLGGE